MLDALEPGAVVGGRFAVVGLLGAGGTANVYLVVDQLRGERIALKVVHGHLAADPATRRRLRREVATTSLLTASTTLTPWDLHELDGRICLTMPYHPGQTLAEHVAANGPLKADAVREAGIRLATALQDAHRHGILHRDVTANNVLVEHGRQAMLMDFGLARAESSSTRSTALLGTAGFAAPELYDNHRATPSADLYGLGCVLYLALTGRQPFAADTAVGTLQRQLQARFTPIRELAPSCPDDLARTVELLLAADPASRPANAGEVLHALEQHASPDRPRASLAVRTVHLAPGPASVVVRERDEDRGRRRTLRVDSGRERKTFESVVSKRAQELMTGVLAFVGLHEPDELTPEDLLVRAVAEQAGVEPRHLRQPPTLVSPEFLLVRDVSIDTAHELARLAQSAGFKARVHQPTPPGGLSRASFLFLLGAVALLVLGLVSGEAVFFPMMMIALAAGLFWRRKQDRRIDELPVVFDPDLTRWLDVVTPGRHALEQAAPTDAVPAAPLVTTPGARMLQRVETQLSALENTVVALDLAEIVRADLRTTAGSLRERATELAAQVDRLEAELARPLDDLAWVEPRLSRLRTKRRAGEPVDEEELTRLEGLLLDRDRGETVLAELESKLTAATAGLLEIASTAADVRRELLNRPQDATAEQAVDRLRREMQQAQAAQRELYERRR